MRYLLFTYGTLQKHNSRNYLLKDATYLGPAKTTGPFQMKDRGDFPILLTLTKEQQKHPFPQITGELYEVNDAILKQLDVIEGHPDFFERNPILVDQDGYLARPAITYLMRKDKRKEPWFEMVAKCPDVPTGFWNKAVHQ